MGALTFLLIFLHATLTNSQAAEYVFSGPPTPAQAPAPSEIAVDLVVAGVDEENKDQVCMSVASDLGGIVMDCEIEGRRSLQEAETSTLAVVVGDVDAEEAEAQVTSDDFVSTLDLPEGVEVQSVEVANCGDDDWDIMWEYSYCSEGGNSEGSCGEGSLTRTRACDGSMDTIPCPECGDETAEDYESGADEGSAEWTPSGPPTDGPGDVTAEPAVTCEDVEAEGCLCVSMTTLSWGNEIEWTLVPDVGDSCSGGPYENYATSNEMCCLAEGATGATLTCKDSYGDGWHGGFVTILGEMYCRDFDYGTSEEHFVPLVEGATPEPTTLPPTCEETAGEGCICATMNTQNWGYEVTWTLIPDNAESEEDFCSGGPYENYATDTTMCCFPEGAESATLECIDSYGDGWHGGFLSILGVNYCENFSRGRSVVRTVPLVEGAETETSEMPEMPWMALEILNNPADSIVYGLAIVGALSTMYHAYTTFLKKKAYQEITVDFEEN